ncbi:MAG: GNAT family N-acetyltransferase [Gammaproteobacteria bacterium]|nr:GNAT family N-acetyltransferase [Gammaproteobacteria bacterium]
MSYEIRAEVPTVRNYIDIRIRSGLSRKSEEAAARGLPNSIYSVVAYHSDQPVGLGRIVGDGGCFYEVTDICVLPEHQKKGVGVMIMQALMTYLHANAPSTAYVTLMADHGTPYFYTKFGFQFNEMPKSSGMHLRIK